MESFYLWPEQPAVSLLALWAISSVVLWAARGALRELIGRLSEGIGRASEALAARCQSAAAAQRERTRSSLLARGGLALQDALEAELPRVERGFSERLGQYSVLHRKLDELLQRLEQDYRESGVSPPEVPGWTAAVESIAGLPSADHPSVKEILDGVQRSLDEAQRQALHAYRADAAERHEILDRMRSVWKEVHGDLERTRDAVEGAIETAARVETQISQYADVRDGDREAARALARSALSHAVGALVVFGAGLGTAVAGVFLLETPLGALLPEGAALGGVPGGTLVALAWVSLALGLGMVALDLMGKSERFPRLLPLAPTPRRALLGATGIGLLGLSIGGAVCAPLASVGFLIPWLVALAALPLETLLHEGRHLSQDAWAALLHALGSLAFVGVRLVRALGALLPVAIDAYVSIPLRIEEALARRALDDPRPLAEESTAGSTPEEATT
jgi:hypothetical protein